MKIALINLAYHGSKVKSLPLGMTLIAHALQSKGLQTYILDAEKDKLQIKQVYEWCQLHPADLIAINSTSYSRFEAADLAQWLKKDGVRWIVLGGHHYTHLPVETLQQYPFVDFVISGPAEKPLTKLCKALEVGRFEDSIQGLTLRREGRIKSTPHGADHRPVDPPRLPFELFDVPAYSTYDELLFLYNKSHSRNVEQGRTLTYFLSRGCPYSCYFCANVNYWNPVAFRSLDYAVSEIAYLRDKYKITHFIMIDPSFSLNRTYTVEFCNKLIKEKINIRFFCSTRVNLVDPELLELMAESGLDCIQFGIESGSQKVLNGISKGIRLEEVQEKVLTSVDMGLIVKGYFMFGHPNETEADVRMTINFAKDLYDASAGKFVPVGMFTDIYPGSNLERIAIKNGTLDADFTWFKPKIYPQNEKINMGWTMVPIYENDGCKIERILELAYHNYPDLLNPALYEGYNQVYQNKTF